jgi:zinc protease
MKHPLGLVLGLALIALARPAAAAPVIAPDAEMFTLDNGLEVLVIPDHRAAIVTHSVWYKVGAADEERGHSGLAHFLEHLMFKGTELHGPGEFSARIEAIGGTENAFTTADATVYTQTAAREHLGLLMELEADRMANLRLTEADILLEREVILEERTARVESQPGAVLGEAMAAAMYRNHPYGVPIIGWRHEMEALSLADAVAFYERYYTPNNALLVVAGDVTVEEVRSLAEATYGRLPRRAEPGVRVRPAEPPGTTPRSVSLTDPRVGQAIVQRIYMAPSSFTAENNEDAALDLMSDILGSGVSGRLYRALTIEQGIAHSAGARYAGNGIDYGQLTVYAVPKEGVSFEEVLAAMDAVILELQTDGVTEDELARSARRTTASVIYFQDNVESIAGFFGADVSAGAPLASVQNWAARFETVTTADIRAVARRYFDMSASVTGYLIPEGGAQPAAPEIPAP